MFSQVLSYPSASLVPTSSTLGLISASDLLCDLAESLALSGSPGGGVCLLRAIFFLHVLWRTRVMTGLPAGWCRVIRGHRPASLMQTPTLCAHSGRPRQ